VGSRISLNVLEKKQILALPGFEPLMRKECELYVESQICDRNKVFAPYSAEIRARDLYENSWSSQSLIAFYVPLYDGSRKVMFATSGLSSKSKLCIQQVCIPKYIVSCPASALHYVSVFDVLRECSMDNEESNNNSHSEPFVCHERKESRFSPST
jgi:hypothetical protein